MSGVRGALWQARGPVSADEVHRRRWVILGLLCTSLMIVMIGNTSLNVALPTLAEDLEASTTDLQWMVDSYALVFAGMLLTAGALGDRYGRKGALQVGLVLFAVSVIGAALSQSAEQVVAARAVMGFGAAFVMPSTLSLLMNVFPPEERARAIAVWAGISGGGAALGPVASGFLMEHFWWGSVFLVNLPVIALALVTGRVILPKSSDPTHAPLDFVGAGLSILALSSLVYAIIEGPNHGWASTASFAWFAAAGALLVAFAAWERHRAQPMLDLTFFRDRRFSVSSGGITLVFFAMFGTFFLGAQYFQLVLGYSPLSAGVRMLPMSMVMVVIAPRTPKLVERFGPHRVAGAGLLAAAIGLVGLSLLGTDSGYPQVVATLSLMSAGISLTMPPLTNELMASVPRAKAGVGSAMNDTTRELGGALGVAVLGSLVAGQYSSSLAGALDGTSRLVQNVAGSSLAGAVALAEDPSRFPGAGLSPEAAASIRDAAQGAFVDGLSLAALAAAGVVAVAAVAVTRLLPRRDPAVEPLETTVQTSVDGDAAAAVDQPLATVTG